MSATTETAIPAATSNDNSDAKKADDFVFFDHHPVDHDPTTDTLKPLEDSVLTIRLIK